MKTGIIIACRLKSRRLYRKALLPISGHTSIELCLRQALKFPVDEVILATSYLPKDAELFGNTLFDDRIKFFQGDPENLIDRYREAAEEFGIDIVVRATGDCPVLSPEIGEILLDNHILTEADYTEAVNFAIGTQCQIFNLNTLQKLQQMFPRPRYPEHMSQYVVNNPGYFKINRVELDAGLVKAHRLTLDYPEDARMFNVLFKKINERGLENTLKNIYETLDEFPEITAMNAGIIQELNNPGIIEQVIKDSTYTGGDL